MPDTLRIAAQYRIMGAFAGISSSRKTGLKYWDIVKKQNR